MIAAIRSELFCGIPQEVRSKLPTGLLTQDPYSIRSSDLKVMVYSSDAAHRRLKGKAKRKIFTKTKKMADYFKASRKLQGSMF